MRETYPSENERITGLFSTSWVRKSRDNARSQKSLGNIKTIRYSSLSIQCSYLIFLFDKKEALKEWANENGKDVCETYRETRKEGGSLGYFRGFVRQKDRPARSKRETNDRGYDSA